ncbi:MAG TPA: thioredoxin [Bacteroidetes bacterium]|nr:thioredoxin [Bacteroidota bacterium]
MASFNDILASHPKVLIDFSAEWCGPCKALAPILHQLKENLGEEVKIVKIDVDRNPELAAQYQIQGVPTMILFKEGRQVWRQSGVLPKSQLEQVVRSH